MDVVELRFPVLGDTLAVDHGYELYGALSRKVPVLHAADAQVSIGPIGGDPIGHDLLRLSRRSRLRCRLPVESICSPGGDPRPGCLAADAGTVSEGGALASGPAGYLRGSRPDQR
jgi:hypothetical protein